MEYDNIELPVAGELSANTTPRDLERARRIAAYWHVRQAVGLWPWYSDLLIWLGVVAMNAGLIEEEDIL